MRRRVDDWEYLYLRFCAERCPVNGWQRCFYCGLPADTFDHQPPLSRIDDYRAFSLLREVFVKVPCCRECNTLLGDMLTVDLIARERIVKQKLAKRYRKFLTDADWSAAEMDALGKNLRSNVKVAIEMRDLVEGRIDYSGGVNAWIRHIDL